MSRKENLGAILAVYLLGLLVGGLYVGMVAPVRLVIQEFFQLGDTVGIWMINIYTLFYAALIPVVGKIADLIGRKPIVVIMVISFFVGCIIISMTLIPELAEFVMNAPTGSGGVYVIAMGVLAMFGPMVGGRLIDKIGPKPVMMAGLAMVAYKKRS